MNIIFRNFKNIWRSPWLSYTCIQS